MGRISRKKDFDALEVSPLDSLPTENSRYIVVTLSDGSIAHFSPVLLEDIRALASSGIKEEIEAAGRLIIRQCIKWGDKPGITLPQLRNCDLEEVELISESLVNTDFPDFTELPDRSLAGILSDGNEIIFRRPTYGDVEAIAKYKNNDLEAQVVLATRLCVSYGNALGISEAQLDKLNMGDWGGISTALQSFRSARSSD